MKGAEEQNRIFFDGIYQEVWRSMIPAALTEAEAEFIIQHGTLTKGSRVLDLMCGYGRHALALAGRGCRVHAIDSSDAYIQELKTGAQDLPIEAQVADVSNLVLKPGYDAAICMGNSFSFLSRESLVRLFASVQQVLAPGGVFIINTWMIAEIVFRHFKEREWHQVGPFKYLVESSYHTAPSRICAEHTIISADGKMECLQATDFIFSLAEVEAMLTQCGFGNMQVFATPRNKPFQLGDNKAYILARKEATF